MDVSFFVIVGAGAFDGPCADLYRRGADYSSRIPAASQASIVS